MPTRSGILRRIDEGFGRLADSPWAPIIVALFGLLSSLGFSLVLYPSIGDPMNILVDPDGYGDLGRGLLEYGRLAYYPDTYSTLTRGPVYPAFIAAMLGLSNGWYPASIQIGNCILFSLTAIVTYFTATQLHGRRIGLAAGVLCALHPLLFALTGKVMLESLSILLFTLLVCCTLAYARRPSLRNGLLSGLVLALLALSKAVYLPFLLLVPVYLYAITRNRQQSHAPILVLLITMLVPVLAWTSRNYAVGGMLTPNQKLAGYNLLVGDMYIDGFDEYGFLRPELWSRATATFDSVGRHLAPGVERELYQDSALVARSINRYVEQPMFLARKIMLNSVLFWTLGESRSKTLFFGLFQFPLLAVFVVVAVRRIRRGALREVAGLHFSMVALYFLLHLPIFAFFRASSVLIPTMIIYAAGTFVYIGGLLRRHNLLERGV